MNHNTFEPCKDHENGHFGWCLLCEIEQLREELKLKYEIVESQRENINILHNERTRPLCKISNLDVEIKNLNSAIDMYKRT